MMVLQLQIMFPFSGSCFLLCFRFLCLMLLVQIFKAQSTTDPSEVVALNTILGRWGKAAAAGKWNISGDPCTGWAIDSKGFEDPDFNPAIKCVCSFVNNTVCHITQLRVYALDVVGKIPEELQNLTYLTFLKLDQNYLTGTSTEISFHVQQTKPSLETENKESYPPSPSESILHRLTAKGR